MGGRNASSGKGVAGALLAEMEDVNIVTSSELYANLAKNGVNLNAWDGMRDMTRGESIGGALNEYSGDNYKEMKTDYRLKYIFDHTDSDIRVKGTRLYRGQTFDREYVESFKPGKIVQERGVSSWSRDFKIANEFAAVNKTPVIFVERSRGVKNAISIEKMTGKEWEREVLYAPNQKFRIQSISHTDITNKYGSTKRVAVVEVTEI